MTTEIQTESNRSNALLSTGPKTEEGKAIVSQNAVKHGIFARDLLISCGDGKEDEQEYCQLLDGLILSLNPKGQMESLIVEKIAVDFWRLKRVLRCETGSIRKYLDTVVHDYYHKVDWQDKNKHKTNEELDEEIAEQKELLKWNNCYLKLLKKGIVKFDKPTWEGEGLESNIEDDLFKIFEDKKEEILTDEEYIQYDDYEMSFEELKNIFQKAGYTDADLTNEIIRHLKKENDKYQKCIKEFEQEKLKNKYAEEVCVKVCSLPSLDNSEKVLKYEKALQRSILQNLALLKRLQCVQ